MLSIFVPTKYFSYKSVFVYISTLILDPVKNTKLSQPRNKPPLIILLILNKHATNISLSFSSSCSWSAKGWRQNRITWFKCCLLSPSTDQFDYLFVVFLVYLWIWLSLSFFYLQSRHTYLFCPELIPSITFIPYYFEVNVDLTFTVYTFIQVSTYVKLLLCIYM